MTLSAALLKTMKSIGVVVEDMEAEDKPIMIPSGSLSLDIAMGGGLPRGRLTTLTTAISGYGKDTTVNLFIRAITTAPEGAMLNGGRVAIFNQERKMSREWTERMGADMSKVSIFHSPTGEAMFKAIFMMLQENAFDMIVVNTVKATRFAAQIEAVMGAKSIDEETGEVKQKKGAGNGFEKGFIGISAKHWSFFRTVTTDTLADSNTALVTLNHSSAVIAANVPMPDSEYGGKALLEWASLRLRLVAPILEQKKDSQGVIHDILTLRVNIIKNNFMQRRIIGTKIQIIDGVLNPIGDVTKFGREFGLFEKEDGSPMGKGGGKWHFDGVYLGKSEAEVQQYLLNHVEMYGKIYAEVCALASHQSLPEDSALYATTDNEMDT